MGTMTSAPGARVISTLTLEKERDNVEHGNSGMGQRSNAGCSDSSGLSGRFLLVAWNLLISAHIQPPEY